MQQRLVDILTQLTLVLSLGILLPQLMILSPLVVWTNRITTDWIRKHHSEHEFGEILAISIVVQAPSALFQYASLVFICTAFAGVSLDLSFDLGPLVCSATIAVVLFVCIFLHTYKYIKSPFPKAARSARGGEGLALMSTSKAPSTIVFASEFNNSDLMTRHSSHHDEVLIFDQPGLGLL